MIEETWTQRSCTTYCPRSQSVTGQTQFKSPLFSAPNPMPFLFYPTMHAKGYRRALTDWWFGRWQWGNSTGLPECPLRAVSPAEPSSRCCKMAWNVHWNCNMLDSEWKFCLMGGQALNNPSSFWVGKACYISDSTCQVYLVYLWSASHSGLSWNVLGPPLSQHTAHPAPFLYACASGLHWVHAGLCS